MTIILDFDDVLFDNTAGLKQALAKIFKKHKADFWGIYSKIRTAKGGYSLKKHFVLLKRKNKAIDIKGIKEDTGKLLLNTRQFLFPDVLDFLKAFKKHTLILLSWGDKKFQKRKIYGLGQEFVSLFDKIITGPTEKAKVLSKILKLYESRPVVFIDNDIQELESIKSGFKDIVLIRLERSASRGLSFEKGYLEAVNLKEVEKLLKSAKIHE
jgi:FMN phosphatase YigB (HAD superfamily)